MAITLERTYTIPLRRDFIKVPKHRRAKRAIGEIRTFMVKHMKTEDVRIGKELNEKVWGNGIKNPPGKVKVKAVKKDDIVTVELEGFEYKVQKVQAEKTEEKKGLKGRLQDAMGAKKTDSDKNTEKPKDAQKIEKKTSEAKKEKPKEEAKPEEKPAEKKAEPTKK